MKLRLLSYNIQFGGRGRVETIAAVIDAAGPDIIMLQEATDHKVVARLAELTAMPNWDSRPNHSTGYLTKLEVKQHNWHLPQRTRHAFLELEIAQPSMRFFGLHLSAWFSNWSERQRRHEIRSLLEAIREHQDGLHFIAGDFNALAPGEALRFDRLPNWIRALVWFSGRDIARHTIQHMLDKGYADTWRIHHDEEPGYTFPTWDPHVRLDYVFTPGRYRSLVRRVEVFQPAAARTASDHYPLLVELDIPG